MQRPQALDGGRACGRLLYAGRVRCLGIDYGRKRIGLALSDPTGLLARPWKTIEPVGSAREVAAALASEIARLGDEEDGLRAVVLGLPRRLSGDANEQTAAVQALAASLRPMIPVPLVLQDERLTSVEAEAHLATREKDWRKRKAQLDAASAAVILQDYLDALQRARRVEEFGS